MQQPVLFDIYFVLTGESSGSMVLVVIEGGVIIVLILLGIVL